ncbi:Zinc transport system ATP-binding protein TroB [Methylocella tundrae]|uniref:Zinc transport system ATP-binding protein TroB n=1 Tax=Methylocella tundrae TaxID=227605 RepID=A0A8B6M2P3_METTU|nr:ABC transporter ATP-binding protein [Methylocella tundrae]VTZ26879.1 Zinc transport system ATP-binding protein TroB [Methylocella tundrae]VTZ49287.1 Zinc transport system ATP-binding protein TroB [Methylocella tundrae]
MTAAIRFSDLTLGYDRHPAVHHLDGDVESGSLLAICGPNGAGKSTLLKAIAGSLAPLSGSVALPHVKTRDIAYLPQAAEIDKSFPINVFDVVAMGLWSRCGLFGAVARRELARVHDAISAVGLDGFEDRAIGALSGGQLQRMLFARLLLQDAAVILLDEPFTAIDSKTTADLLALVARWSSEKRTVLAVLHDFDIVREHFPQTLLLAREKIAWGKTADVLTPQNLLRARSMIEAFDRDAQACSRAA